MKTSLKNRKESGFTIIEVLIVLAIAGLIMVILFLAVPALNRNAKNTQYRSEASQLLSAATEQSNNKNGGLLVAGDNATVLGLTKNKNITNLTIEAEAGTSVPPVAPAANAFSTAVIRTGAKCNAAVNETDAGSPRGIAILFNVQNGSGGSALTCIDS